MNMDFEQTIAMLNGQSIDNFMVSQLTTQDKAQIDNAIDTLFSGLSLKNWLDGGTLGNAWTVALDAVRDIIFATQHKNPATLYAQSATFRHRAKWQSQIIASRNAQEFIRCPDDQRNSWYENANTKIQNSIEILRQKFIAFESSTPRKPTTNAHQHNNQNMNMIGEHEHERERVHEK